MKKFFLMAFFASLFAGCESAPKVDNSTVKSVDLNRYVGSWYEIAKFDHSFERGLSYAMAKYTLRDDGKIDVLNTGIKDGRAKDAKGIAKTTGVPGLLRVSFFGPFFGDYRIMMLDEDYQYVLVGGSNHKYLCAAYILWILYLVARKLMRDFKGSLTMLNFTLILGFIILIGLAHFSGALLKRPNSSVYMAFVIALLRYQALLPSDKGALIEKEAPA